jgi:hypothetical protein
MPSESARRRIVTPGAGFASLSRADAGFNLIFLRTGLATQREGVTITTPLQTEPWGERFFQVADPNGVIVQFVQWVTTPTG